MDVALWLAIGLLVAGILASLVPGVSGALLSLAGILGYWWASGYTTPGPITLLALLVVGFTALLLDLLSGMLSARVGGVPTRDAAVAAGVGLGGLLLAGPIGALVGIVGTVFGLEYHRSSDVEGSLRVAALTAAAVLASSVVQVLLTALLLVGFVVAVLC